jgi:hypothetical protein
VGSEKGFYSVGQHFADRPIVSIGAGFDVQPRGAMDRPAVLGADHQVLEPGTLRTAWAVAADLFADIPVGAARDHEFTGLLMVLLYDHGRELVWDDQGRASVVPARTSGLGIGGDRIELFCSGKLEEIERVLEAVKALDYRPDLAARRLRSRRTDTIGLVIANVVNNTALAKSMVMMSDAAPYMPNSMTDAARSRCAKPQ